MNDVNKKIIRYVIYIIIIIAIYVSGFMSAKYFIKPIETIRIVEKFKEVSKYIKIPMNCDEYKKCYDNQITIDGEIFDNVLFKALASDGCKETERVFKLHGKTKINPNIILLNYIHMVEFNNGIGMAMGGNISYYRLLFPFSKFNIGLGGGLTITNHSAGLQVGTAIQF